LHRHRRRSYVPGDMLSAAGLAADRWLDESPDERHRAATLFLAEWGRDHLAKARAAHGELDAEWRPLFLPLATVAAFLHKASRAGADSFVHPLGLSPLRRQWLFAKAALTGRIP
ncbi:MAG: squalene/phytoene synthase family protein, partial [Pseudomonadota bacterium]|nr:squalene/phytoene synthase family protein [Pseudomonadota bacterium]